MTGRWSDALVVVMILVLSAGDALRYSIGYVGWGIVCGTTIALIVAILVRQRARLRRLPMPLVLLTVLMPLSAAWAISPAATLLGSVVQLASIAAALLLSLLEPERLLRLLHGSLQGVLAASIAFELAVATLVGGRVYPIVPPPGADYSGDDVPAPLAWSRGLLLEGGRIQGIVGNANLLAMLALLALVLAVGFALRRRSRSGWLSLVLPLAVLALTRSATVVGALLVVCGVAGLLVLWTRLPAHRRAIAIAAASLVLAAGVAVVALRGSILDAVGRDADLTGRLDIWSSVIDLWLTSPVVGVGWMGYWQPWVPPFDALASLDGVLYLQAHSVVLDVLMQLGVVGLIVWIGLQASVLRAAVRWLRVAAPGERALAAVPLLLLVALLVQGLAESRPLIELGFVLLVAFAVRLPAPARHEPLVRA